jgi:N-acetylmuramoyl-L-alanine amidase
VILVVILVMVAASFALGRRGPSTEVAAPPLGAASSAATSGAKSGAFSAAPPESPTSAPTAPAPSVTRAKPLEGKVVAIDPGHAGKPDLRETDPLGPGSSNMHRRDVGGTAGVVTLIPESLINLKASLKLRDLLEAQGAKVVMIRTTQDVNISSLERAEKANEADADLFVRVHCDGNGNRSLRGISVQIPAEGGYTAAIYAESAKAAEDILVSTVAATGAASRGVVERSDLVGFNWSKVPAVLIEMGFMSNPAEDRLLATPEYQAELAQGLADGVLKYLEVQ